MYPTLAEKQPFKIQNVELRAGNCTIEYYGGLGDSSQVQPMVQFHGMIEQAVEQQPKAQALAAEIKRLVDDYNSQG